MGTQKDYWIDSYARTIEARVTRVEPRKVVLDRTIFYPGSGGQASDKGRIVIDGHEFHVQDVIKEGEEIVHVVDPDPSSIAARDAVVLGRIDWERRLALMRGHTAQHVISAHIHARCGAPTASVSIQPDLVGVTLRDQITSQQLEEAILSVNEACTASHQVVSTVLPRARAVADFAGRIRGEMSDEDPVRIMEIRGLDVMCCGGTHVRDTAEIGPIAVSKFKAGREIKFATGKEALALLATMNAGMLSAAASLNKEILQVADAVEKQVANNKLLDEQSDTLSVELLEHAANGTGMLVRGGVHVHVIKGITNKKLVTASFNSFPGDSILVIHGARGGLHVYSNSGAVKANELIQAIVGRLGGKGGGNPRVAQGMLDKEAGDIGLLLKEILGGP